MAGKEIGCCLPDETKQRLQAASRRASDEVGNYLKDPLLKKGGIIDGSVLFHARLLTVAYVESLVSGADQALGRADLSYEDKGRVERIIVAMEQMAERKNPAGFKRLLEEDVRTALGEAVSFSFDVGESVVRLGRRERERVLEIGDRLRGLSDSLDDSTGIDLLSLGLLARGLYHRYRRGGFIRNLGGAERQRLQDYGRLGDLLVPLGVLRYAADRLPSHAQSPLFDF